jgi:hypothetical protein
MPLAQAISQLLEGQLVFRHQATVHPYVEIIGSQERCWSCGDRASAAWDTRYCAMSACAHPLSIDEAPAGYESRLASEVQTAAKQLGINASIKPRHSKTLGRAYQSFGCARCDAIFGDWFLREQAISVSEAPPHWAVLTAPAVHAPHPHWCVGSVCTPDQQTAGLKVHSEMWLPV